MSWFAGGTIHNRNEIWVTSEGYEIPIKNLGDKHLHNIIRLLEHGTILTPAGRSRYLDILYKEVEYREHLLGLPIDEKIRYYMEVNGWVHWEDKQ